MVTETRERLLRFTVEVSLHDDAACAGAFRCENPRRALVSRGTARHIGINSVCEDWTVVNAGEFIKISVFPVHR